MADGADGQTNIWKELEVWAKDFKSWQRYIIATAVRGGKLGDAEMGNAYKLFLNEHKLGDPPNPTVIVPAQITGRPTEASQKIFLSRIDTLKGINALPEDTGLDFTSGLTVIYGNNGAGKSSFARVLSNACFSRSRPAILRNVYLDAAPTNQSAMLHITDAAGKVTPITFDLKQEITDLKRIAVFDTAAANAQLNDQSPLGFIPAGFDILHAMVDAYTKLSNKLSADIKARERDNKFPAALIGDQTTVSTFVATLGADTDLAKLEELAIFGEKETARLAEIQSQIDDLKQKSSAEAIKALQTGREQISALQVKLQSAIAALSTARRVEWRQQLSELQAKSQILKTIGADSFKNDFFKAIGTSEWERFLMAAQGLARLESAQYPASDSHCLLCHRPLDAASQDLIKRFWTFLTSDAKQAVKTAQAAVIASEKALATLSLDFFAAETTVFTSLTQRDPNLANAISAVVGLCKQDQLKIRTVLAAEAGEIPDASLTNLSEQFTRILDQLDADIKRLSEMSVDAALKSLDLERQTLRHREVLKQQLPDIRAFVNDQKWVKVATSASKKSLATRFISEKQRDLFDQVIAANYRKRLQEECNALDCDLPVEFMARGDKGQTMRALKIKGAVPANILSEGEQRAIALADFLTEVSLNTANAGIIVDDPVNSQDHLRKARIASRLVDASKERQVIIFTHDLVFLTMLLDAAEIAGVTPMTHWVQRNPDGQPGQVSPEDCPATTPSYRKTEKAQKSLAEALKVSGSQQQILIQRGMGELRRTIEEIVPYNLFKDVVKRWNDRIMVTKLKEVNWDNALAEEIIAVFEELSAYIEGHTHTEERAGSPPDTKKLKELIDKVDNLIKRCRPSRPK